MIAVSNENTRPKPRLNRRNLPVPDILKMVSEGYATVRRWIFTGILVLSLQSAFAQIRSGTIVVWMATDHDLVIAADSRVWCAGASCAAENPNRDRNCKIRALKSNLLFSLAGMQGDDRREFGWEGCEIASKLADAENTDSADAIDALAHKWLNAVLPLADRSCRTTTFTSYHGPMYTTATFAGVTREGTIHVAQAEFRLLIGPTFGRPCADDAKVEPVSPSPSSGYYFHLSGSGTDLVKTFLSDPKNRSEEAPNLRPMNGFHDWQDLARTTYRLAQIAIEQSGETGDVGGPIDQAHLSLKGVEWLHRKDNCTDK